MHLFGRRGLIICLSVLCCPQAADGYCILAIGLLCPAQSCRACSSRQRLTPLSLCGICMHNHVHISD